MAGDVSSRRRFLALLLSIPVALATRARTGVAAPGAGGSEHPEPRKGIDGSSVLTRDQLHGMDDVVPIFDGIRDVPHVADGIRCHCGCADLPGYRSLLSCFEGDGMAMHCDVCQGMAKLVVRRARQGQSLDQIRRAVDARFAPRRRP